VRRIRKSIEGRGERQAVAVGRAVESGKKRMGRKEKVSKFCQASSGRGGTLRLGNEFEFEFEREDGMRDVFSMRSVIVCENPQVCENWIRIRKPI
jgi:hypothetical protein